MTHFLSVQNGSEIKLPGTTMEIDCSETVQAAYAFSNNDPSEKNIWCWLKGKKDVVIDGGGASLVFRDRITPFLLDGCENICIRNFVIDYDRPFFTQGTILYADETCVELQIPKEYPYRVEGKNLIMEAPLWENDLHDGIMLFQEFDPRTRSLAYDSPVLIYRVGEDAEVDPTAPLPMKILTAEQTGRGTLRLHGAFPWRYTVGNVLVMTHEKRCNPGIGIHNCRNILLEDIHIVHTGSMGIVAQLSADLTLRRVQVALGEHPERLVSTNCDAAHFVACSGSIEVEDCRLEHMMDDGINVHGVYTKVISVRDRRTIDARLMHFQHFGVKYDRKGDQVAVYCGHSTQLRETKTVASVEFLSSDVLRLSFEEPIETAQVGDFLENLTATPSLHVKGLRTGYNRPRGILATTPKKVLIEDCLFYNSGYGVHIAGDTAFWYESGATKDVEIRNNRFINCGHDVGNFAIALTPEYEETAKSPYFHGSVKICGNTFTSFTDGIVYAYGVTNLCVMQNEIRKSLAYQKRVETQPVVVRNCKNVECDMEVQHTEEAMW